MRRRSVSHPYYCSDRGLQFRFFYVFPRNEFVTTSRSMLLVRITVTRLIFFANRGPVYLSYLWALCNLRSSADRQISFITSWKRIAGRYLRLFSGRKAVECNGILTVR